MGLISSILCERGVSLLQTVRFESFWRSGNLRGSLLYPNGRSVSMSYDSLNRVKSIDQNIENEFIGHRLLERRCPNGSKRLYHNGSSASGYDRLARTTQLRWLNANNQTITDFGYGYDRENHRTSTRRYHELSASNKPKGETYRYDSAYRLTEWKEGALFEGGGSGSGNRSGGNTPPHLDFLDDDLGLDQDLGIHHATITDQQNWKLDGVGNWEQMSRRGVLINSSASVHNEYTSFGNQAQTHDNNGNLLDDGTFFYDYDFLNRLRRVVRKTNLQVVATYDYDAFNRRVFRETTGESALGTSSTRYFYDGWHAIEERDASNTTTKQFVYGERLDEILKMDRYSGGTISSTYYYHSDVLGSVVALSDASGNVVERVKYSPYGQPYFLDSNQQPIRDLQGNFALQSSVGNLLLFTAARYDSELSQRSNSQTTDRPGNYYLRNRYLNPNQGRFLTRDPIGIWTDTANLGGGYSYAANDPVNQVDPLGLLTVHIWNFQGKSEAWGHVSITLENGTHISWWPQDGRGVPSKISDSIFEAPAYPNQTLDDDIKFEGKAPDRDIKIIGLDEAAIETWWNTFRNSETWRTVSQNCSTTAADALKAGGADVGWGDFFKAHNLIWAPGDVEAFADAINRYLAKKKKEQDNKKNEGPTTGPEGGGENSKKDGC